ncbi:Amidase 1 [Beauveria bassiana D1-5]|uniref:Amidase 1 n=1 Tax=Beauveria bassiana D1-5 TaxID=1245745 RepID=A0A0A2V5U1_BEABA|nr:Amidase 1 [Beauveria bassiana D1-5]
MTVQTFKTAGPTASQLPLLSCRCIRGRSASQSPTANNPLPSAVTTTVVEYSPDAYVIQGPITKAYLQDAYRRYLRDDDVFCDRFLKHVLLTTNETSISDSVRQFLAELGCTTVILIPDSSIAPGPYFYSRRGLFWAWKLYKDDHEAFVLSTIPSQQDTNVYQSLNASALAATTLCVAVPSRLYFEKTPNLPLAGLRIAIKDLFHLNGVPTGCGNRAYRSLHPTSNVTTDLVQDVVNKGAIIVGKTKTVEFGGSQEVIGDWCDYSYAFNARGDGYLASTGSSTGSASSLAAYPWLDITLGTDAGGSIRDPAVAHGIYGFRPSHDGTPTQDAMIPCPVFHTPGFLGRSYHTMLHFSNQWSITARAETEPLSPTRILFPPDYYVSNKDVQALADDWVNALSRWLQVEVSRTSIQERWAVTKPTHAQEPFEEFFSKAFIDILSHEYWTHAAPFRKEYEDGFASAPYVCKLTEWLWKKGQSVSSSRKQEALAEVRDHNHWLFEHFLENKNDVIIIPRYTLDYRDEYLPAPENRNFYGFESNLHASFAGLPNIVVPIGQCPYYSNVTKRDEVFPVSLSIIGPKGFDLGLLRLIYEFLSASKLPMAVSTGTSAFNKSDLVSKTW